MKINNNEICETYFKFDNKIINGWSSDKRYTDIYFAQANNEEEYIKLIKDLYGEHEVTKTFSCTQWSDKEHLFNEDIFSWHEFFNTECIYDDKYEDEDLPLPQNYSGNIGEKPNIKEYPIIIMFCNAGSMRMITWYSI